MILLCRKIKNLEERDERKIGELTTADGVGYAIALGYPTEGQWDIENESEPPQGYSKFYDSVEKIVQYISGVDGLLLMMRTIGKM